jgi:DNA-directed RNA polymerase subunit K/omega
MSDDPVPVITEEEVGEAPPPPQPTAPPVRSRFLFVDIAAQRAKQLRRGARPRVDGLESAHKLERVAMREVSSGYVDWTLPPYKGAPVDATT